MQSFFNKWNTYQKERFPLVIYSLLILALSLAAGALMQSYEHTLSAFVMSLGIFMLLRIADEFKDYEDDCAYRPYRAVPRGLISLKELGYLGAIIIAIELALAYQTQTLMLLVILGLYWFFMSKEFFVPTWLKAHPVIYLLSHMMIMPLIAGLMVSVQAPQATQWPLSFLLLAFFNGVILEVGRKIRQKEEEEDGVETYSFLWGKERALKVWITMLTLSLLFFYTLVPLMIFVLLLMFELYLIFYSKKFLQDASIKGKKLETLSGVWLLLSYILIYLSDLIS